MDDMISRQAAIDALDVLCQEHRYKIPGKRETYSQYNEAWQDALDRAEGAIFNLPSAQPGWIPCSERLPEYGQFVLVSINGSVGCDVLMHCNKGIIWHYDGNLVLDSDAWQPLPEAYQEG